LFLGTHKDNHQDRAKKGRNADKKGQKHHLAKLKNEDVFAIFEMSKNGMNQTQISKIFNVNPSTISFVLSGRNWSHLKGETSVI
jgi:hypothetical protein